MLLLFELPDTRPEFVEEVLLVGRVYCSVRVFSTLEGLEYLSEPDTWRVVPVVDVLSLVPVVTRPVVAVPLSLVPVVTRPVVVVPLSLVPVVTRPVVAVLSLLFVVTLPVEPDDVLSVVDER